MQPISFLPTVNLWPGQIWLVAIQFALALCLIAPIAVIFLLALGDSQEILAHLISTVLPLYISNTIILMLGTGGIALIIGVSMAWLVSRYEFPFRRQLALMLILPAAIPSYIIAYAYTIFLEYAGPVQTGLRAVFGFDTRQDYWFPEIRSLEGAMFVMGCVLYPYVFLFARSGFALISSRMFETALMSGRNLFTTVAVPMGRPAIIAGLALVLMEVVADFGTVDFFAVPTISLGVFNVWLGMNNITAAAQLSVFTMLVVFALLFAEHYGKQKSGKGSTASKIGVPRRRAIGSQQFWLPMVCLMPVLVGFVIPVLVLVQFSVSSVLPNNLPQIVDASMHTLFAAGVGVVAISITGVSMGIITSFIPTRIGRFLATLSAMGYAIPGTILALGVLGLAQYIAGVWVGAWSGVWRVLGLTEWQNFPSFLTASLPILVLAYAVRFQITSFGATLAATQQMPSTLVPASRVMGHGFFISMHRITVPLIRPSLLAAALLIFVDIAKELPLTLLLRPIGFDTLAVITYQFANNEQIEQAALPALLIVLIGILPVLIIQQALYKDI